MRILVVEDEPQLLEIIVAALDSENDITEMATDFSVALDRIMSFDYDCIVLDIDLPGGTGADVLEELKKRGKADKVLIISPYDAPDVPEYGASYLRKPFHIAELIARVKSIGHRRNFDIDLFTGNRRYPEVPEVNINVLCASLIEEFLEVAEHYSVNITVEEDAQLIVPMHPDLAVILVANLIRNALVHNVKNGSMHVRITEDSLTVENTGSTAPLDPEAIFGFYTDASGPGLAIVRAICESTGMKIRYNYDRKHIFELAG